MGMISWWLGFERYKVQHSNLVLRLIWLINSVFLRTMTECLERFCPSLQFGWIYRKFLTNNCYPAKNDVARVHKHPRLMCLNMSEELLEVNV